MQQESNHQKVLLFARILSRIVLLFILAEIVLLPLRSTIVDAYAGFLAKLGITGVRISWECTAVDETLLVLIAVLLWRITKCTVAGAVLSALAVQAFNVIRIAVLSVYPDPLLHEILFRAGGYIVVVTAVAVTLLTCEKFYKAGNPIRDDRHGRRRRT